MIPASFTLTLPQVKRVYMGLNFVDVPKDQEVKVELIDQELSIQSVPKKEEK